MKRRYATTIEVLEVLTKPADSDEVDALFDQLKVHTPTGVRDLKRSGLKEAVDAFAKLIGDVKKAELYKTRLGSTADTVLVSWRAAWAGGPMVPVARVRLDQYVEQLDICPPETAAGNGRKYSEHRLRVERRPDGIFIHTTGLAAEVLDADE